MESVDRCFRLAVVRMRSLDGCCWQVFDAFTVVRGPASWVTAFVSAFFLMSSSMAHLF